MTETLDGDLYDYPRYYDLVFGSDWKAEFDFLRHCFEQHAGRTVRRLFEPACGTGRLLYRLAKVGYEIGGLDLNPRAIAYCNARLERHGLAPSGWVGDMSEFSLPRVVDASFNTINSFRHLRSERAARAHLQCMADATGAGGLYLIGLHLTPTEGQPMEEESWSARRGHLCVTTRLWTIDRDVRKRCERFGMTYDVYTPTRHFQLEHEVQFRTFTARQFSRLLQSVSAWEVAETYDFSYCTQRPIEVRPDTEDIVYVLRKRASSR